MWREAERQKVKETKCEKQEQTFTSLRTTVSLLVRVGYVAYAHKCEHKQFTHVQFTLAASVLPHHPFVFFISRPGHIFNVPAAWISQNEKTKTKQKLPSSYLPYHFSFPDKS